MFYNSVKNDSVDIIWKNKEGTEQIFATLAPNSHYTVYTFFTHEWIFKRSSSNDLLYAELNGIKSKFFEGCRFKATFDRNIVTITSGIAYMIYWNNDFSISDYSKSFSELFIWAHFLLF